MLAAAAGIACVWILIRRSGPDRVWEALTHGALFLPWVILCEGAILACDLTALSFLYGKDRSKVPVSAWIRSGLICYAIMSVVPMGRAVAEATRAAMLARYVSGPKAAASAARMQGVALLGNAALSLLCAVAALAVVGPTWFPAAVMGNCLLTLAIGSGILLAGRHTRVGTWIGKRFRSGHAWGLAFDEHFRGEPGFPRMATFWVTLGRAFQTLQRVVLIAAVGGGFGLIRAMLAEGIHLVSGSVGDLIPAQVGITEAGYTFSAAVLGLSDSSAVTIALLAHLAVVFWVAVGSLVPLVWRAPEV